MHSRRTAPSSVRTFGRSPRASVAACLCLLALAGCELTDLHRRPESPPVVTTVSEDSLKAYLDTMTGLAGANPARKADIFYEVEREYTRAPTTSSTLRYAVALATPDHPATNSAEGKRLLETLLATPERMAPAERALAEILLHDVNARLKIEAENRRLLATLDDRSRSQANSDKRVQTQIEENLKLRRALAEAQQKLDAIKEIERSIIERSPSPPGSRDTTPSETQSSPPSR